VSVRDVQVVITAFGAVSGAGDELALRELWLAGGSSVRPFEGRKHEGLPPGYGAAVDFGQKQLRHLPGGRGLRPGTMTANTFLAVGAVGRALQAGGLDDPSTEPPEVADRRGVFLGTYTNFPEMAKHLKLAHLQGSPEAAAEGRYVIDDARIEPGMKGFTGFDFLKLMNNMPTAHAGIQAGARGPANTILGHSAAGLQAIGRGWDALLLDQADQVVAGGAGPGTMEGLCLVHRGRGDLSSPGLEPGKAARPLDRQATGLVPGDGGAAVLLETAGCAAARGVEPLARLVAWDERFVAPTADRGPLPDHAGIVRLIRSVLDRAGWSVDQVDLLAGNGAGLADLDGLEAAALAEVFGVERLGAILTLHTGVTGFAEAAHGPLGLVGALQSMQDGLLPPMVNLEQPWGALEDMTIRTAPVQADVQRALVLSLAPEGTMAAVAIEKS
jgi:3-oxoacyl-(acyl-carrier-protein) synthase